MTARDAAIFAVLNVTDKGRSVHRVVSETLANEELSDARDRALAKRLIEGTVERKLSIDHVINSFAKTPVDKMKPYLRAVVRVAVYQILFMDNIPDAAACNEAVKYVKEHGLEGLSGFVNGLLRNIARNGKAELQKATEGDSFDALEIKYSVPQWLLKQWERDLGRDNMIKVATAQFDAQPLYFRVNESKCTVEECLEALKKDGIKAYVPKLVLPGETKEFDLKLIEADAGEGFADTESFKAGLYTVQDISSVIVGEAAGIKGGETILDLCAAPGGKTLHFADKLKKLGKGGRIDARDVTSRKINLINESINRCGFDNIDLSIADASVRDEKDTEKFDLVLADVPCSGTGITGRKPDIKYNMSERVQDELIELQHP
ncbi:MAG: 16S rRNA (cytosine(967)-C(5))-methyltransferase RsmB, partial [Lachnospiraceae bacterium]|nr:16S rRNA (cytosine(967)-C(5))-methyltransferase RsmB [Lachnospiraceae bacterium]